jgi:hypothetical protein
MSVKNMRGDSSAMAVGLVLAGAIIASTLILAPPAAATHPRFHDYEDLVRVMGEWRARGVKVEAPVTSEEGRKIFLAKVGNGPFTILYTNLLHAEEPSGTEAFIRFVWALLGQQRSSFGYPSPGNRGATKVRVLPGVEPSAPIFKALASNRIRQELLDRVTIIGFPMLDPDGLEADHARDGRTNTDYATKLTPQSAAIEYAVNKYKPDLMLDSHGGPPEPELNIGLVEPAMAERAVLRESRRAAAISWRAASARGVDVSYWEEGPEGDEPIASYREIYWTAVSKLLPLTQEWYQTEGLPVVYTETVSCPQERCPGGGSYGDNVIDISEGASAQQLTMMGLALEYSGLLSGERPQKVVEAPDPAGETIVLREAATRFFATVHWKLHSQDYELQLVDGDGEVVSGSAPDPSDPYSYPTRSRAIFVAKLPPGRYRLVATPTVPMAPDGALVRANWRIKDHSPWKLGHILDKPKVVELCLERQTAYGEAGKQTEQTRRLTSPQCNE